MNSIGVRSANPPCNWKSLISYRLYLIESVFQSVLIVCLCWFVSAVHTEWNYCYVSTIHHWVTCFLLDLSDFLSVFSCPAFPYIVECSVHFPVWVTHGSAQKGIPRVRNPFHRQFRLASPSFYSGVGWGELPFAILYLLLGRGEVDHLLSTPPSLQLRMLTRQRYWKVGRAPRTFPWVLRSPASLPSFLMLAPYLSSGVLLVLSRSNEVERASSCLKLEMWSVVNFLIICIILMWPLYCAENKIAPFGDCCFVYNLPFSFCLSPHTHTHVHTESVLNIQLHRLVDLLS